jgi:AbrB family looped-hinge helix DNA binding protein
MTRHRPPRLGTARLRCEVDCGRTDEVLLYYSVGREEVTVPIVKIRTNRQVSVPKVIFDDLGLKEGDFVEVNRQGSDIVIRPKRLVDLDDTLSPEEEKLVEQGFRQLRRGDSVLWSELRDELDL